MAGHPWRQDAAVVADQMDRRVQFEPVGTGVGRDGQDDLEAAEQIADDPRDGGCLAEADEPVDLAGPDDGAGVGVPAVGRGEVLPKSCREQPG
ncbi:hypothetical protein ABZW47_15910 [Streptomyces sp. NPDC004549]|uniref:hypothetical protein n=1 Tax=Streptomyces sp. NPDC004549 TaxID=3154283 RepID=UPI0033A2EA97